MNFNNLIICVWITFYVIGDISIKPIVKFMIFLASLLKKSTNYLKNVIFKKKI